MKRIYSSHAYEDERISSCFWAEAVPEGDLARPAVRGAAKVDVAIIGGGFTGLSAALHLAEQGVSTTVLDARHPGWGASGRNGGFCCLGGSKLTDAALDRAVGKSGRLDWRRAERDAVELVSSLIETHGIDADRHSAGETQLAHSRRSAGFDAEARAVSENYGVDVTIIEKPDLAANGMGGGFHGAMTVPIGFALHPRKYLAGLLDAVEAAGGLVHGNSPVSEISRLSGMYRLETEDGHVTADTVLLATNGYSSEDVPDWMAARYLPAQSSVIVTRPLSVNEREAQGWTTAQMAYDTRNLLHYFRLMPDGRFLFGMRGGLRSSPGTEVSIKRLVRRDFEAMFPAWAEVDTPYYWSGMVCLAPGFSPYCGPVPGNPGMYAGFAYHGNGVAMGSYTGALLAELALGKSDGALNRPEIMSRVPERFSLGRFRRAMMYAAYAGFWLSDRFG